MPGRQQENGRGPACGQGYALQNCAGCRHAHFCPEVQGPELHCLELDEDTELEAAEDRLFDRLYPENDC